ncbi:hypothetical protein SIO70_24565 [Chitinophaga sancti]|uniref:hypothetical protein n=1 Tax=Chitinophaga sancti TaxID=1004 RepID=UPI002A752B5B|nr:hypothetical protein [Chitinophaga sancti]WPQ61537.1 hypothetical protein SIO70_24565 [Chitinophaga sancti]
MIPITNGTKEARYFTFILYCWPLLFVLVNICSRHFGVTSILVDVIVFSLTIWIAYAVSFNDYEIWLSQENNSIIIKRRELEVKYEVDEFLKFRLGYYPFRMSSAGRYYELKINRQSYRIRILITKSNRAEFSESLDPERYLRKLEEEMKDKIRMNMSGWKR